VELIKTMHNYTDNEQELLYHLAGNLATRRTKYVVRKYLLLDFTTMNERLIHCIYFTANSLSQLSSQLIDFISPGVTEALTPVSEHTPHRICFVSIFVYYLFIFKFLFVLILVLIFPGQGSQWIGCGVSLYQAEPIFRSIVDTIDGYFFQLSGRSLKAIMLSEASRDEFDQCDVAQPFCFMIQVGLVELCRSIGIHPTCIVGHSAGELAAAYASGAIPLKAC
jgi:acyl transferase domain-containing protein